MLHVILLDCSIEQVPRELTAIKQIQKDIKGRTDNRASPFLSDDS